MMQETPTSATIDTATTTTSTTTGSISITNTLRQQQLQQQQQQLQQLNHSRAQHSHPWLTSTSSPTSTTSPMLCASFNQDGTCLSIGTQSGFTLFHVSPYQKSISRDIGGGLSHVEMLFRCNLIAMVGGGLTPKAAPHVVLIWDDHVPKAIGELSFRQSVLNVKLRRDSIAVALRDRIYIYHLTDLSLRDKVYTTDNPHGLMALSTAVQDMVLACPSTTEGHVRVELYGLRKTVLMEAHTTALRQLALTEDGKKLATASIKGTIIRVFCCPTSTLLQEFRRGMERVDMTCLVWSFDHSYIACCSDKGTAHVFGLHRTSAATDTIHHTKSLSSRLLNMMVSGTGAGELPKSISQVRGLAHPTACAFLPDQPHTLALVGWDHDGNGVLILSDVSQEEAVRRAYHIISKRFGDDKTNEDDNNALGDPRRKKRVTLPNEEPSQLFVGDRLETQNIIFEDDDDGFLTVNAFSDQIHIDEKKEETKESPIESGTDSPERVQ